jgi:glutathione synthase/RimK-type ligase-like ATP-grasp enzyme
MMKNILIITNKEDITVDFIIDKLNTNTIEYYRFNTEDLGTNVFVSLNLSQQMFHLFDAKKNEDINLSDIEAVYYRRPKLGVPPSDYNIAECDYSNSEHYYMLEGIYRFLDSKKWLNNVYDIRKAENKIFQMCLAQDLGFSIPNSLITNLPNDARKFLENNKRSVFKSIKCGLISDSGGVSKVLFTSKIDNKYIENIESICRLPTYYQEEIIKKSDIRVTVVGDELFPAEIDSQGNENTSTDWRNSSGILPHSRITLPEDIKIKCLLLCKKLNLNFAAIDLIRDVNGEYWFLEINPNGQWAWIELLLKYPISDSIMRFLVGKETIH